MQYLASSPRGGGRLLLLPTLGRVEGSALLLGLTLRADELWEA